MSPGPIGSTDLPKYPPAQKFMTQKLQIKKNKMQRKIFPLQSSVMGQLQFGVNFRFFGCGLVAPEAIEGKTILDLGSGSGQDCFVLSKLVGENDHVTGVDMTQEQLGG